MLAQNGNSGQNLQRGCVSATDHHNVRLTALVVAGPRPDTNPFGTMHDRGIHVQPLGQRMLSRNHYIHIVSAAQTVIKYRQQAVGVGRKVNAHNIGLLVDDVVQESRILVREAVVILLPDVGGEQIVERGDLPAPGQLQRYLQPLGVLVEH